MELKNFWLNKVNETNILKVVEWAHRHDRPIEKLSTEDIIEAMRAYLRDSSHC
jgi:hypothetical protein